MIVVDVVVREYIEPGSPRARPGSRPNLPETPPRAVGQASAGGRCVGLEVVIQTDSSPGAAHLESLSVLSAKHTHTPTHSLTHHFQLDLQHHITNPHYTTPSIWSKQVRGSQPPPTHCDSSLTKRITVVAGAAGGIGQVSI
jgi:hypothetical protein